MVRPRASLLSPRVRPLNTTPKTYLQKKQKKKHMQARTKISSEEFRAAESFLTSGPFLPPLQFTVLDEDALSELVSFLEDLLVVYIGHGRDEALEEQQDVADPQGSESPQQPLPPLVPRQGRRPRLAAAAGIFKEGRKHEHESRAEVTCFKEAVQGFGIQ